MPPLSRRFIRSALFCLVLGTGLGGLLLAHKGIPFYPGAWRLLPLHMELLLLGWVAQLGMGVAFWILPRFLEGARRGNETVVEWGWWLFNIGLWLVLGGSWFGVGWLILLGRLLELAGGLSFALHLWPRVMPHPGSIHPADRKQ